MEKELICIDAGLTRYENCWRAQKKLVEMRAKREIPDCLILTEHYPVITLGRGTDRKNLLASDEILRNKQVDLFEIERGGDITFHGPGQLVAYPIIDLTSRGRDMHKYLRDLEEVIISTLKKYDLKATTKQGLTGVWVNDSKVAAIGVGVSHWITYHGLALNINTDLDYFSLINPCGITQYPVSSLARIKGTEQDFCEVKESLNLKFIELFGYSRTENRSMDDLIDTTEYSYIL